MALSELDKRVLTRIQAGFPIEDRPYAALGELFGVSEGDVMASIDGLRRETVIRRVGAIFDSHRLGYRSTLCAIASPPDRVDEVAAVISAYPNVTHNYLREDRYDIWFTLIARSAERIDGILSEIADATGIDDILNLPAIRLFKIRVDFDLTGERGATVKAPPVVKPAETPTVTLSPDEQALAVLLQADLPPGERPFAAIRELLVEQGVDVDEGWLLERTRHWVDSGVIRRFGAAIRHHQTGYTANAMGVWTCPEDRVEEAGRRMATFPQASHVYQRPSAPTWPANLYTMLHGRDRDEVSRTADRIREAVRLPEPRLLYSVREFKKTSMTYFAEGER